MIRFFKKRRRASVVEDKFNTMMVLIKDLPKADYKRLKDAMDLGYDAYQKVRNVKTTDEKEVAEVDDIIHEIELEGGK